VVISIVGVEETSRLGEWLTVRNELEPDEPLPLEQLLARRAAEPERRELLATAGEEIVGVASVGPKGSPPDLAYGYIGTPDAWKGCGVEQALLAELRRITRALGRSRLELWAREDDQLLIACLEDHGFREVMREGGLALDIADAPAAGEVRLPEGVTVQPIASRPELGDGAYELAAQTWADIPGETGIEEREQWLSLHVTGAPEGAVVALHAGTVVGFAGLYRLAENGLYEHGLLTVRSDHRRRGIARAMKITQLLWLSDHDARRVVTWNAEANDAARRLNLSLGYSRLPSSIAFHGPA
jgi:GNAT superfamily N-acetyltransferase